MVIHSLARPVALLLPPYPSCPAATVISPATPNSTRFSLRVATVWSNEANWIPSRTSTLLPQSRSYSTYHYRKQKAYPSRVSVLTGQVTGDGGQGSDPHPLSLP